MNVEIVDAVFIYIARQTHRKSRSTFTGALLCMLMGIGIPCESTIFIRVFRILRFWTDIKYAFLKSRLQSIEGWIYVLMHGSFCPPINWRFIKVQYINACVIDNYRRFKVPTSGEEPHNSQSPTSRLSLPKSISCTSCTVKAAIKFIFLRRTFIDELLKRVM